MSKIIRIGTRDSQLALWQANTVKDRLEALGHKTALVPVKSTGDLVLDKPLHELGITGIFTKTLDVALLKGEIDIAVHSMKDVPTLLPNDIVSAAILERGNFLDILAYKDNQEFLAQEDAMIATGSLRRKAQWLNRYPTHTITDLRGNVNTRIQKLRDSDWNGAIFAAAGLERIGIKHKNTIGLTWMLPAPAQGAIMVVARKGDVTILDACQELNHESTEICTNVERQFLNKLEGGCTAPIGALAKIEEDRVVLQGVLLSIDGSKKLESELSARVGEHHNLGRDCANSILARGGKRLMSEIQGDVIKNTTIFATKKLTADQLMRFGDSISVDSEDFIQVNPSRIPSVVLKSNIQNVIITSQNAVEALLTHSTADTLRFENIYCVGRKTKRLIEQRIGPVKRQEKNATKLAQYLVEYMDGLEVTYFCSDQRLDDLPNILMQNNITVNEVEAYRTKFSPIGIANEVESVLFFSPSGIESYLLRNPTNKIAYCIGETTAKLARKHFTDVRVARIPTIESVIDKVNEYYSKV
ncbi:hydroxymethylbilane synthase [Ulvibacterium sp.]|uniref:hydroxymethylbilane synthase n=1 Tax=Ulvibacterium sp. TaxID=2665914 RepID=UPI0026030A7B|nr:hydroxymethylbilane synthase [Ulvibacterium sp.]